MVPVARVGVFEAIFNFSHGMTALIYLVAGIAMVFSAISYKEMAKEYPVAGSVYSYVRLGTTKLIGFLAGWAILLDYLLLSALLAILGASAMAVLLPQLPGWIWSSSSWVSPPRSTCAVSSSPPDEHDLPRHTARRIPDLRWRSLFPIGQGRASFSLTPLFQPEYISLALVFKAIPLAALAYIGFDAISTLNEEAKGGGKTVSKATMIVLVLVIVLFVSQVYLERVRADNRAIPRRRDQ